MKRIAAAAALASVVGISSPAIADPADDACELMSYFAIGDLTGARSYWETLIAHWQPDEREQGTNNIFSPIESLAFSGLSMFRILDLEDVAEEFLAVSGFSGGGRVYFRIFFEKWGDEMRLVNFRYQQDYEQIAQPAFAQPPAPVSCQ